MKKLYSKPEIMFEDFTLSENIAGDCEAPFVGNPSKDSCAIVGTGEQNIFSGRVSACEFKPEDFGQSPDMWNGLCYHTPTDANNLFNS